LQPGPFRPDPDDPAARIHHTGDLAIRSPDGLFTVIGRRDRQVKIRGNRVEPAEIEAALRQLPAVREAAVVARTRAIEPELIAFIVPTEPPTEALRESLALALEAALPAYMQPSRVVFMPSLPLLPGGKIDVETMLAHGLD
jgi:acyl-coenzyme A synthetase/AMP-(fatty) acid ligase